ncbi:MAG: beta-galactosidase [Clostridia bacterium]
MQIIQRKETDNMISERLPKFLYGGDYNPDQWPEETWDEDIRLLKLAHVNVVTLPVFSWAKLQPSEEVYDFDWLDKIINKLYQAGIYVCLATPTAAHPAWMAKRYPDTLPVDEYGRKATFGRRVNFCPNSKTYRHYAVKMAQKMASRYQSHPALIVWHIANEYGGNCYCETCKEAFHEWLKEKYQTIETLNKSWYTNFWGHTYYDFGEIALPSQLNGDQTCFQPLALDYKHFMSDAQLACFVGEYEVLKKATPDIKITTNLMGSFPGLDYGKWAKYMDIVSWDNYPGFGDPYGNMTASHSLMRALKGGAPFMLMEQTPSQQNWAYYNTLKRPGVMRLWSYQAVANGADSVMFFQMKRSIGACEKYHGAIISHAGHENTRVFRECAQLGEELTRLDELLDTERKSKVGVMFDWDNYWATEMSSGPSKDLRYVKHFEKYFKAFSDQNIPVDALMEDADFSTYEIIVAPLLYMLKPGVAKRLEEFVHDGGTFVTTYFSGYVNENDIVKTGGYPGELRKLLGIWVEEIDALPANKKNQMLMTANRSGFQDSYTCGFLCDLLHTEGAQVFAVYGEDFYQGMPALTVNQFGNGKAYYIATDCETPFLTDFSKQVAQEKNICAPLDVPAGVEVLERQKDGVVYTFVLNHNDDSVSVELGDAMRKELISGEQIAGKIDLKAKDVLILV